MKLIDKFLNSTTMYKLMMYGLLTIIAWAFVMSVTGQIFFQPIPLVISLVTLFTANYGINAVLAKIARVPFNIESAAITSLIMFLLVAPPTDLASALYLILACAIAMASKYILAPQKVLIFNPAALGAVFLSITGFGLVNWWVASAPLLPVVLVVGLLIVRKLRRFDMVATYAVFSFVVIFLNNFGYYDNYFLLVRDIFVSWPLIFLGCFMFTEPLTTPHTTNFRRIYALIVAVLFGTTYSIGSVYSTPELALIIGNLFSFAIRPKYRLKLKLIERRQIADKVFSFMFTSNRKLDFKAGQYLEWTIAPEKFDSRGNRRFFTIASSPTEDHIALGIKIPEKPSFFKRKLSQMKIGDSLVAGSLTGDFTLPLDASRKLVFIAGGIGVTPFRSMIKYLMDTSDKRDIHMFYCASSPAEFAYSKLLDLADKREFIDLTYLPTKAADSWKGKSGFITKEMVTEIKDFTSRTYFLSGPPAMVDAYKKLLKDVGIPRRHIMTDYFPGY